MIFIREGRKTTVETVIWKSNS